MRLSASRRSPFESAIWLAAGVVLLSWPAVLNGFMILYADTGRHLELTTIRPYASPVYNLWLYPLYGLEAWWMVQLMQAALMAALLWVCVRRVTPSLSLPAATSMLLFLSLTTYCPLLTSTALPDFFTPIGALTLGLWSLRPRRHRVWLLLLLFAATIMHPSHLAVFSLVFLMSQVLDFALQRGAPILRSTWPVVVSLTAAAAVAVLINAAFYGRWTYSIGGPVTLLSRFQEDGLASDYLRDNCPTAGYDLCQAQDQLPTSIQQFLWTPDSVVQQMGGFEAFSNEASQIVFGTVSTYPLRAGRAILTNTARCLLRTSFLPYPLDEGFAFHVRLRNSSPELAARVSNSLQFRGHWPGFLPPLHSTIYVASLVVLPVLLGVAGKTGAHSAVRFGSCLAFAVLANAVVMGGLSTPVGRYAARAAWLVPFACVVVATGIYGQLQQRQRRPHE